MYSGDPRGKVTRLRDQLNNLKQSSVGMPTALNELRLALTELLSLTPTASPTTLDPTSQNYIKKCINLTANWISSIKKNSYHAHFVNATEAFITQLKQHIITSKNAIPASERKPVIMRMAQALKSACVGLLNLFGADIKLAPYQERIHQQPKRVMRAPKWIAEAAIKSKFMGAFGKFNSTPQKADNLSTNQDSPQLK